MTDGPVGVPPAEPVPEEDWARLVPVSTRYGADEFPLKKTTVVIGRGTDSDLHLPAQGLSRHHAMIRYNPRTRIFFVLDNASKNGTYLNKKKVVSHDLSDGDLVQFHTECFRFEWAGKRKANLELV